MAKKKPPTLASTPGGAFHADLGLPVEYRREEHCAALSALIDEARAAGSLTAVANFTKQLAALGGLSAPLVDETKAVAEPATYLDSLRERLATARDMRQRASKAGSFGSAAQLLHQELDILRMIADETRAQPSAVTELSDADLVAQIAADVAALPPTVRARVQSATSGPSLRLVGTRKTTA
jgi:hypothetical protein